MKIVILILIISFIFLFLRFFSTLKKNKKMDNNKKNIVDLEKDPNTNEYKPKK
tara:strand:+ start:406 stop:564 length:159 start_codon:yes stop_codon:yes gene_type:complete